MPGSPTPVWRTHLTDADGNELTIAIGPGENSSAGPPPLTWPSFQPTRVDHFSTGLDTNNSTLWFALNRCQRSPSRKGRISL